MLACLYLLLSVLILFFSYFSPSRTVRCRWGCHLRLARHWWFQTEWVSRVGRPTRATRQRLVTVYAWSTSTRPLSASSVPGSALLQGHASPGSCARPSHAYSCHLCYTCPWPADTCSTGCFAYTVDRFTFGRDWDCTPAPRYFLFVLSIYADPGLSHWTVTRNQHIHRPVATTPGLTSRSALHSPPHEHANSASDSAYCLLWPLPLLTQ